MCLRKVCPFLALTITACATADRLLPTEYAGPKAVLAETFKRYSGVEADFFGVERINDTAITNSLIVTRDRNRGKGIQMAPVAVSHDIPATIVEVALVGKSAYGAPILELMNKTYEIRGVTKFLAKPGATYTVRGELGPSYSAIWINDDDNNIVGEKIEKKTELSTQ